MNQASLASFFPIPASAITTAPSADSENSVHFVQRFLRKLMKGLPRVDKSGVPYVAKQGTVGRESENSRQFLVDTMDLHTYLDGIKMVNFPVYFADNPKKRAEKHRIGMFWTQEMMRKARDEFIIPNEMKVIFICPELADRDLLSSVENFQTETNGGIMAPCTQCGSNKYMEQLGWTSSRPKIQQVLNKEMTHDIIVGATYGCYNTEFGCCRTNHKTGRKSPKTFTVYVKDFWTQYPDSVRSWYQDFVSQIEDRSTNLMVSPGLCNKLLFFPSTFEQFADDLSKSLEDRGRRASNGYYSFVSEQETKFPTKPPTMSDDSYLAYRSIKWPGFDEGAIPEYFKIPTSETVQKMFHDAYDRVEIYLLRDLFSRSPGRILRVDGTFSIMKKTMNTPDCEEPNDVHVKVLGEYGHILTWAFAEAELNEVKERLFYFLKKRLIRIRGAELVDAIVAVYDDTCCCNKENPKHHFVPLLFPGCKRAPLKDAWHGVQVVLRQTAGFGHPLHDGFRDGLWGALLKWEKQSSDEALDHFMRCDDKGRTIRSRELARVEMKKQKRYRDSIYNYISARDTYTTNMQVHELYQQTKALDISFARDAETQGKGYRHYFLKAIPGIQTGAEAALNNFCEHIVKGCFVDPLPCREMSYDESDKDPRDGGPRRKKRCRGTNIVEIDNKYGARKTVDHVTRQKSSLTHRKYLLHATTHNLECDRKIEHITGKKAKPQDWFIREALRNDIGHLFESEIFPGEEYPGEFDVATEMEPIGELYQKYTEWSRVDRVLEIHYNHRREEEAADVPQSAVEELRRMQSTAIESELQPQMAAAESESPSQTTAIESESPSQTTAIELESQSQTTAIESESQSQMAVELELQSQTATVELELQSQTAAVELELQSQTAAVESQSQTAAAVESESPSQFTTVGSESQSALAYTAEDSSPIADSDLFACDDDNIQQIEFSYRASQEIQSNSPRKKKNVGLGSERWGERVAGYSAITAYNLYIQDGRLTALQHERLMTAFAEVQRIHGDSLQPEDLARRVAQIFNFWHIKQLQQDGVGFGGKIREKRVQSELKLLGRSILKGVIGLNPTSQPGAVVPAGRLRVLTSDKIDTLGQKKAREILKEHGLSQNGTTSELQRRLKRHFSL